MRWFIIIVIVGVVIFLWMSQTPEPPKPAATPAAEAVATPAPTPFLAPSAPPVQSAAPVANPNVIARMQAVARQVGIQLRNVQVQPSGSAIVFMAWGGDDATRGGSFLEECLKQQVITNFDVNSGRPGMLMENGQRLFTAQYTVSL